MKIILSVPLAGIFLLFLLSQSVSAAPPAYVKGEVLIQLNDQMSAAQPSSIAHKLSVQKIRAVADSFYLSQLKKNESVDQAIARLSANPLVKSIQPNFIYRASSFTPDDPLYPRQWNFQIINASEAWELDQAAPLYGGDPGIIVAMLDTGIAYETYGPFVQAPDLADTHLTPGYDFVNNDEHPNDDNGHGTHMAGTIAESTNNALNTAGLAFETTLMPVKVLDSTGQGTSETIIQGIRYAMDHGAKIINMSFGSTETGDDAYAQILAEATEQKIVLVAAAGNAGSGTLQFPASHESVISVGAIRYDETKADYSNYGTGLSLVAPGGDISEDQNNDGSPDGIVQQSFTGMAGGVMDYSLFSNIWVEGTSSATAHVSAAASLLLAHGASVENVRTLLGSTAKDLGETGYDTIYGYGLLDIWAALDLLLGDVTPPTTSVSLDRTPDRSPNYFLRAPNIALSASDDRSTITATYYHWDNGEYIPYHEPIQPPEGTNTLQYYSVDAAGNAESPKNASYIVDTRRLVTGAGQGGGPQVRVFSAAGLNSANFFAYQTTFKGGINVALGDVDGDSQTEIVTAPWPSGGPQIRVFSLEGKFEKDFFAYASNFRGGVNLAVGDLDGDKVAEIITVPMGSGGPNVRIFGYRNGSYVPTTENFMAYDKNFRGGVSIATADLEGDGISEIITAPLSAGGPQVRIFGYRAGVFKPVVLGLMAYADSFRGGVTLTGGDVDGDGQDEIITGVAGAGGPQVRIFGRQSNQKVALEHPGFMAFAPDFRGGLSLATIDFQADGKKEIAVAVRSTGNPLVRIFNREGSQIIDDYLAYAESFKGGVNLCAK
ncbi:MAG: S8 family serine peptidase [Patescibacteria group bacterium]|nr:S8 family serine peptidase [Patescibacteria group bacterium]